jgi:hypothetical protein
MVIQRLAGEPCRAIAKEAFILAMNLIFDVPRSL